jgi:hypothetical protein
MNLGGDSDARVANLLIVILLISPNCRSKCSSFPALSTLNRAIRCGLEKEQVENATVPPQYQCHCRCRLQSEWRSRKAPPPPAAPVRPFHPRCSTVHIEAPTIHDCESTGTARLADGTTRRPAVDGESCYLTDQRRLGVRQPKLRAGRDEKASKRMAFSVRAISRFEKASRFAVQATFAMALRHPKVLGQFTPRHPHASYLLKR